MRCLCVEFRRVLSRSLADVADCVLLVVPLGAAPARAPAGLDHGVGGRGGDLVIVGVRLGAGLLPGQLLLTLLLPEGGEKERGKKG